jgi:hypothetical protein
MTAVADAQLVKACAAYSEATAELYNLLLKDNDGEPIAALGALSIFRIKSEQSILEQLRGHSRAAKRRRAGRGHGMDA